MPAGRRGEIDAVERATLRRVEPGGTPDWHQDGALALPAAYAEWAQEETADAGQAATRPASVAPASGGDDQFRILSPEAGDVYRVPAGVEARYATVALRAAGGAADQGLRWYVDGRPHPSARWALAPGRHRIGAVDAAGDSAEVAVTVE
jgi:membrane carboxypeptidase/penicillin-binding protein PbpC